MQLLHTLFETSVILFGIDAVGREKLLHRESDASEQRARIVLGDAGALLIRHTVIVGGDEKLGVALKTDDAELPDGHIPAALRVAQHKPFGEGAVYKFGDGAVFKLGGRNAVRIRELAV